MNRVRHTFSITSIARKTTIASLSFPHLSPPTPTATSALHSLPAKLDSMPLSPHRQLVMPMPACVRAWWRQAWVRSADAKDKAALQQLESRLSMEQIAHFRAFVAARSSRVLAQSELHLQHAVDAVDAVVANLGASRLPDDAFVPVVPKPPSTLLRTSSCSDMSCQTAWCCVYWCDNSLYTIKRGSNCSSVLANKCKAFGSTGKTGYLCIPFWVCSFLQRCSVQGPCRKGLRHC